MKNFKKTIYLIAAMLLGFLLAFIVYAELAIWQIEHLSSNGNNFWEFPILAIVGITLFYFIGQRWWQIIYVERRHWQWKKKK